MKKEGDTLFDIAMVSFDENEISELVGLYVLDKLSNLIGRESVGLYRDNKLAAINSSTAPVQDKMKNNIIALFKNVGLSIAIETNLFETDF